MRFKRVMQSFFICLTLMVAIIPCYASAVDGNPEVDASSDVPLNSSTSVEYATKNAQTFGTITVSYVDNNVGIANAAFNIYKIADRQDHLTLAFQLVDVLSDLTVNITSPSNDDISKLAAAVTEKNISSVGSSFTDSSGKAVFSNVEEGLYLLIQTNHLDNYKDTTPSLISLPSTDGQYSVTALPKVSPIERSTPSTTPTTTIEKSSSPKTGVMEADTSILKIILICSGILLGFTTLLKKEFFK